MGGRCLLLKIPNNSVGGGWWVRGTRFFLRLRAQRAQKTGDWILATGYWILFPMNHEVFAALGEALSRGEEAALVTIVASNGSTPQRVGAKMLVFGDGRIVGTVGGGCYENDAIGKARQVLQTRKPQTIKYDLNDDFAEETGLVCGGQMEVFIEPIEASPAVYIFGAGHVGYYLARMVHEAGFAVHVIDDRAADLARAAIGRDLRAGLGILAAARDDGVEVRSFIKSVVDVLRSVLLLKAGAGDFRISPGPRHRPAFPPRAGSRTPCRRTATADCTDGNRCAA